ncbi:MAG TPA: STAS/SEC14 domain-containing protein [Terriglobales bacterium]|nr:STAS/SEC14 domain-containing protein [Terriglobales bacterium]
MIERLQGGGLGFKATAAITLEDVKSVEPQIQEEISRHHHHPIGILVDLSDVKDVEWRARWEELRFLSKYGGPIARVAVIGARKWEELMGDIAGATVLMQADVRYFNPSEIMHAWHWVKTAKYAEDLPIRPMLPPGHVMSGYNPEYTDL